MELYNVNYTRQLIVPTEILISLSFLIDNLPLQQTCKLLSLESEADVSSPHR